MESKSLLFESEDFVPFMKKKSQKNLKILFLIMLVRIFISGFKLLLWSKDELVG